MSANLILLIRVLDLFCDDPCWDHSTVETQQQDFKWAEWGVTRNIVVAAENFVWLNSSASGCSATLPQLYQAIFELTQVQIQGWHPELPAP